MSKMTDIKGVELKIGSIVMYVGDEGETTKATVIGFENFGNVPHAKLQYEIVEDSGVLDSFYAKENDVYTIGVAVVRQKA